MNKMEWRMQKSKYGYLKFAVFTKKRLSFARKKYFITISIINYEQDACTGVHSACQREENGHNLDICALRRLRLRQGQMQGFLGLKVGGGLICKYGI